MWRLATSQCFVQEHCVSSAVSETNPICLQYACMNNDLVTSFHAAASFFQEGRGEDFPFERIFHRSRLMDTTSSLPCRSQADVPSGRLRADPLSLDDVIWKVLLDTPEYVVIDKVQFWKGAFSATALRRPGPQPVSLACLHCICSLQMSVWMVTSLSRSRNWYAMPSLLQCCWRLAAWRQAFAHLLHLLSMYRCNRSQNTIQIAQSRISFTSLIMRPVVCCVWHSRGGTQCELGVIWAVFL